MSKATTTVNALNIIIVEKTGTLKSLAVKDFKEEELFKKCGFKKADGFNKQTEWKVKMRFSTTYRYKALFW
jgi:N-acetylglutamate synthase-like GNAT family acetyltransferase